MATEIEHKFLVLNEDWRQLASHQAEYKQGYLTSNAQSSVRVRMMANKAWLNIKSATVGTQRQEFEYEIPVADALYLLESLCQKPLIEKVRHFVPIAQHIWEIDEFKGDNAGLIVAEIELSQIDEAFDKPAWLGAEVTHDLRYYNNQLGHNPYSAWDKKSIKSN